MTSKQIGLGAVLVAFGAVNVWAVESVGYIGVFEAMTANAGTIAVGIDLMIALSLVVAWMIQDARDQGISHLPFTLLTLALGSVGPLLYLIRREKSAEAQPVRRAQTA